MASTTNQATNGAIKLTGAPLTQAREALGMSQAVAARVMGVSNQSMSSWESERVKPWGKNAEKIANFIMAGEKAKAGGKLDDEPELELEQERGEPREHVARRTAMDDVRFSGWLLAEAEGSSAKGMDCAAALFETVAGTFVVEVEYLTSGRCYTVYGDRTFVLSKSGLPWVRDMIEENTTVTYVDID
jgi:DNA-binding transcriptional regulator YiaG